jgi:anti-sigma regulatory factor (Ser/Thr protein kinase)
LPAEGAGALRLALSATLAAVGDTQAALRDFLDAQGAATALILRAELVLEAMVANVARHAQLPPEARVTVVAEKVAQGLRLVTEDTGPAFPKSLEAATPGGLGIKLSRGMARAMDDERTPAGENRFAVTLAA